MKLFNSLFSGIKKTSLASPPSTADELLPVSLYCDRNSFELVKNAYSELFESSGNEKVTYLNNLVNESCYWGELLPLISGPFWGILKRPITVTEANFVPCIGLSFFYYTSLGMLISKDRNLIFLKINPTKRSGIFYPKTSIDTGIDIDFAKSQMAKDGWRTNRF